MSVTTDLIALIGEVIAALETLILDFLDDSHLHAGHEGSKNGAGHYRVHIVASCFAGLSAVARHRLVYHHLQDLIPYPIHALALDAQAPK